MKDREKCIRQRREKKPNKWIIHYVCAGFLPLPVYLFWLDVCVVSNKEEEVFHIPHTHNH